VVAGVDRPSVELAERFVGTFCEHTVRVGSPEVAELGKLLENAFTAAGIGLIGEITKIAHAAGIKASDVTEAAATKPFGYFPFHPGPGIGGHCIPHDLGMLRAFARSQGVRTPLLDAATTLRDELPVIAVDRLDRLLAGEGRSLAGARVVLVGVGFKVGSADTTETPAAALIRELRRRGATSLFLDTRNDSFEVDGQLVERVAPDSLATEAAFDAALVSAGDPTIDWEALRSAAKLVLDLGGGRILRGARGDADVL
jgi:nucleotide sugar dehydrogenase